jgi:predicted  nucleic acid-binding Zn-ribbon protein
VIKEFEILESIDDCDRQIEDLEQKKIGCRESKLRLENEMREMEERLSQQKLALDETKSSTRSFEQRIEFEDDRIKQSQKKTSLVKSTNEYHKYLKEIASRKQIKEDLEEQLLEIMARVEAQTAEFNALTGEFAVRREKLAAVTLEIDQNFSVWDKKIIEIRTQRNSLSANIGAELLDQYTSLKANSVASAIVQVQGGVCQGCFMQIPPQLYIELQREEKTRNCPTCQRIIYFKREEVKAK